MKLQFIEAGEIVSTHGIRGEMKVLPWVDSPEVLCEFDRVRICGNEELGEITDVLDYPGNSVYVVKGQHEYMIPAVKQFILSTDMENNVMQVSIIEGMRTDEN